MNWEEAILAIVYRVLPNTFKPIVLMGNDDNVTPESISKDLEKAALMLDGTDDFRQLNLHAVRSILDLNYELGLSAWGVELIYSVLEPRDYSYGCSKYFADLKDDIRSKEQNFVVLTTYSTQLTNIVNCLNLINKYALMPDWSILNDFADCLDYVKQCISGKREC